MKEANNKMDYEKKKGYLLAENNDLNISEDDKALNYNALKGIISAKRDYAEAQKENNKAGMARANRKAESIRRNFGYSGGENGDGYYADTKPQKYQSAYKDKIDSLYNKIMGKDEFSYNAEDDPLYKIYKQLYQKAGEDAYDRALVKNSFRTGGIAGSSAVAAATQAQAYYNTQLANKIPELYDRAYQKYWDEIKGDMSAIASLEKSDAADYEKYSDTLDEYYANRKYYDDADNAEIDRAYNAQRDEIADSQWQSEYDNMIEQFNYDKMRDEIADSQWQSEFDYNRARDAEKDQQWQTEFEYNKARDAVKDAQWQKSYNLSAAKKASSGSSKSSSSSRQTQRDAIKNEQWEKQYKLDKLETVSKLAKTIYDTGYDIDDKVIRDLLKD